MPNLAHLFPHFIQRGNVFIDRAFLAVIRVRKEGGILAMIPPEFLDTIARPSPFPGARFRTIFPANDCVI